MTNIEIYQGDQIGGCVTVISSEVDGVVHRIMIDFGSQLPGAEKKDFTYPWDEKKIDAVFFTHNHTDHIGRMCEIPESVDLYIGEIALDVILNMKIALSSLHTPEAPQFKKEVEILSNKDRVHTFEKDVTGFKAISIPGFRIEPYRVDHSAYDAYMFLIETLDDDGHKVILHTGDYRGHGRIGHNMINVIENEIHKNGREVNTLITEGTMMSRRTEKVMTEDEMSDEAAEYLKLHKYAFIACASTNLDAIASFYRAAQIASQPYGRYLYTYNDYFKSQIELFNRKAGEENSVYKIENVFKMDLEKKLYSTKWKYPRTQRWLMEKTGFIACIKPEEYCKKYVEAFVNDYHGGKIDQMPVIIYSMWQGYIKDDPDNSAKIESWVKFMNDMKELGVEVKFLHTSGHATSKMIEDVIKAVHPTDEIIPIHTEHQDMFKDLDIGDDLKEKIKY